MKTRERADYREGLSRCTCLLALALMLMGANCGDRPPSRHSLLGTFESELVGSGYHRTEMDIGRFHPAYREGKPFVGKWQQSGDRGNLIIITGLEVHRSPDEYFPWQGEVNYELWGNYGIAALNFHYEYSHSDKYLYGKKTKYWQRR
jgi:hypothetical protein